MKLARPDWKGSTVVCIASGPSLTDADCDLVRRTNHRTIVTNTTFRLCPWAQMLYAHDSAWWTRYLPEVDRAIEAGEGDLRKVCHARTPPRADIATTLESAWFVNWGNSGANAISLAVAAGASRIVLLGFDCQVAAGRAHWHGDHPQGLSNAKNMHLWPAQFRNAAAYARQLGAEVLNASRSTALDCFPRVDLVEVLGREVTA